MSADHSPDFLGRFAKNYGSKLNPLEPDYSRCAHKVSGVYSRVQCSRKNGHGPSGAWCKQHDPIRVSDRLKAEAASRAAAREIAEAMRAAATRRRELSIASTAAIREIAAGHNDPMTYAREILEKYEGEQ